MENIRTVPAMERIGAFVKAAMIRNCPVDMGDLRRSIDFEIVGNEIIFTASAESASEMEWGTPPEPLSDSEKIEIEGWEQRHKAPPGRIVQYIEKHGIKVGTVDEPLHITSYGRDSYRPFMRPAVYNNMPEIARILADSLAKG